jgi:Ni,Fe-hydrogenase III large subunit
LSDGTFFADSAEVQFRDITKIPTETFLPPKELLSNFIDSLARAAARRKETLKELEMVKRIVGAIASTMQGRTGAKAATRSRRKRALRPRVT